MGERGQVITIGKGVSFEFTAVEALMLLDILIEEKESLRNMSRETSLGPIKIEV